MNVKSALDDVQPDADVLDEWDHWLWCHNDDSDAPSQEIYVPNDPHVTEIVVESRGVTVLSDVTVSPERPYGWRVDAAIGHYDEYGLAYGWHVGRVEYTPAHRVRDRLDG